MWGGHADCVHWLITEHNVKSSEDATGATPLTKGIAAKYYDAVSILLQAEQGGDLEAYSEDGASLLMTAAKQGDDQLTDVLLRDGRVNPNATNLNRPVQKGQ